MLSHCSRRPIRRPLSLVLPSSATLAKPSCLFLLRPAGSHNHQNNSTTSKRLACSSLASSSSSSLFSSFLNPSYRKKNDDFHNNYHHYYYSHNKKQHYPTKMSFHFASSEYAASFVDLPLPDTTAIRTSALTYLQSFDPQSWYNDPIVSLLKGKELRGGHVITTVNALGIENGKQELATPEQVQQLMEHLQSYSNTTTTTNNYDLRIPLRRIEELFLTKYAGFLVGNQCLDFQKQDGVTEIEEAIMANTIERRLNDLLLQEENLHHVSISRKPIHVSCVSNFTNFLDLFRKTIRSLEVGIPCVILGRSNTVQHSYRWTKLLLDLLVEENIDPGMITYLSCSLEDIKTITQTCRDSTGNLYTTCSRELAASIKSGYPNTVASTGGPNTLVVLESDDTNSTSWTPAVQKAIRCSATIESAGQCTALRHVVVSPTTTNDEIQHLFDPVQSIPTATKALEESWFDGVFAQHKGSVGPNDDTGSNKNKSNTEYQSHPTTDACYKIVDNQFPSTEQDLPEYWRKVVVDVSRVDMTQDNAMTSLAEWLNTHQPISLAVNGATKEQAMTVGLKLFEMTGMVVNTIGTADQPAMTCQARPQDAEVFGEFPPRHLLTQYTKFPVVVPSSTPSYDTSYTIDYLKEQSSKVTSTSSSEIQSLIQDVTDDVVRGYCVTLGQYLQDATSENPKRGFGSSRTAMWGLQRPPLGTTTYLRCGNGNVSFDAVAPQILLFHGTNARDQLEVSVSADNTTGLVERLQHHGIRYAIESDSEFASRALKAGDNVVQVTGPTPPADFPMVGQFVSTLFPLGHVKSTQPNDEEFLERVQGLQKWLKAIY